MNMPSDSPDLIAQIRAIRLWHANLAPEDERILTAAIAEIERLRGLLNNVREIIRQAIPDYQETVEEIFCLIADSAESPTP